MDRKIRVALDWLLDVFLPRDIVQLKMEIRQNQSPAGKP